MTRRKARFAGAILKAHQTDPRSNITDILARPDKDARRAAPLL
jgi:hypothetical protein